MFILFLVKSKELSYKKMDYHEYKVSNSYMVLKEEFLRQITDKYGFHKIITSDSPKYRLIGLPLFSSNRNDFEDEFLNISMN